MSGSAVAAVRERARAVYDRFEPIARRFSFERPPTQAEMAGPPLVLFLGNHSSGKSTFVNFLLGEALQKTGLAPTDDAFTIIAHGAAREEKDGATVIANAALPYADLERFGPGLRTALRMKTAPAPVLEALSLVDSPGMIDTVSERGERGYDFAGAVRWFAVRADVVVFMFDPDKPGTTGETLGMLRSALEGLDHKLLIVLNKVDRFRDIHDFARTYGALCWNLSKVLARKDLPHVYNIYVPAPDRDEAGAGGLDLEAFDRARDEVVAEIRRAPSRRVDNIVSGLYEYARRLHVHASVCDAVRRDLDGALVRWAALFALAAVAGAAVGWIAWQAGAGLPAAIVTVVAVLSLAGLALWIRGDLRRRARDAVDGLDGTFERTFERELLLGDRAADLEALWRSVRPRVRAALAAVGPRRAPRLRRAERRAIEGAIDGEIPAMRAGAAG